MTQLAERLAEQVEPDKMTLINSFMDEDFMEKHKVNDQNIIGLFVPDTYEFYWNVTADQLRDKLVSRYHKFWNQDRIARAHEINLKPSEVIALAAIVQQESVKKEEQARIAGVYMNRLKKGMLLQADPTVKYALKEKYKDKDTIFRRILNKDLKVPSPYNTYLHPGLPPGPITMPDIHVIKSVLNYEQHDYFYFVADHVNIGYHKFAKNLKQHNEYSHSYHQYLNARGVYR